MVSSVPPGDIGKASGVFSTMRQLGGAFGVAILAAVFAAAGSYASPAAFSNGFALAIFAAGGLALAAALAALALASRRNPAPAVAAELAPALPPAGNRTLTQPAAPDSVHNFMP